jgi:hypothetical protein
VDRLLTYNRWFKEQVQVGLDQIERGEVVTHEEVGERVEQPVSRLMQSAGLARLPTTWNRSGATSRNTSQPSRNPPYESFTRPLNRSRSFGNRGRAGREANTRELAVAPSPYVIVYKVADQTVFIARIVHGAQDWLPE